MRARRWLIAVVASVGLLAAACSSGNDGSTTPTSSGGAVVPGTAKIGIADLAFEPSTLTVASGATTITVTNSDTVTHTFTLDDGSVDETIDPGQSVDVTVNITATTGFHCSIHTSMTGTLQVA
ncbi:MAG TPA: cupredoxin domain-containing protein [Actinomycetota bacterium]|jgi:plastocyanin